MKQERKFLRQCVSCKEYKNKENLIRITKDNKTSEIVVNNDNSAIGRSVYVCKNQECINTALNKKKLQHALKTDIPVNIKEKLSTVLKN